MAWFSNLFIVNQKNISELSPSALFCYFSWAICVFFQLLPPLLLISSGEEGSPCRASLCRHWQPKARNPLVKRGSNGNDGDFDYDDDDDWSRGNNNGNDDISYSNPKLEIHQSGELMIICHDGDGCKDDDHIDNTKNSVDMVADRSWWWLWL